MTETNCFQQLFDFSDKVYQDLEPDDFLVAISYLQLIRAHPFLIKKYENIFQPHSVFSGSNIKQFLRNFWNRIALPGLQRAGSFRPFVKVSGKSEDSLDILLLSHMVNQSHAGNADDFYYGDLPVKLRDAGYRVGIAYINQTKFQGAHFKNKWTEDGIERFVLTQKLSPVSLSHCQTELNNTACKLLTLSSSNLFFKRFSRAAAQDAKSGTTLSNLAIANNFGQLFLKTMPRMVMFTHEGHAWERLVCAQVQRFDKSCKRAGYIHAALFASQHSIYQSMPEDYCPDIILTTGETALHELRERKHTLANNAQVLGTHKIFKPEIHSRPKPENCLVLPEGLAEECLLLFKFSMELAVLYPHITFIWRLHPVLSFEQLYVKDASLNNRPPNIVISRETFEIDLARAKWALYRGSTAIVQALASGIRPLYLPGKDGINIDPLHQLSAWKTALTDPAAYTCVFNEKEQETPENIEEIDNAIAFSRQFNAPFNLAPIQRTLPLANTERKAAY